jgi:hypothetical protein
MKKYTLTLFFTVLPAAAGAITAEIPAGTVVNGGDVHSIVTQKVFGEANNFTVSGVQQVMNGGTTHNSNIFPYGKQEVLKGGVSYNTGVQYYGVMEINGRAYSSSVDSYGTIDVNAGGYAWNTTVNGGSFFVSAGANADGTVLNSGHQYISGTDKNSTVNGGIQEIRSGGVASGTVIKDGTQQINEGGRAENTIASGSALLDVFGSINGASVADDATLIIAGNGHADGTRLTGGTMEINDDASSANTIVSGGTQYVYGTETGSTVSGGRQNVESGGKVLNAVLSGNGIQTIYNGGTAQNTRIVNGGFQEIENGGLAEQTFIGQNGIQQINDGGTAQKNTVENSGLQNIENGGLADGTTVTLQGMQWISAGGIARNTQITEQGLQDVKNGGLADGTAVWNGGVQQISAGGRAVGTLIGYNGLQNVDNDGTADGTAVFQQGIQWIHAGGIAKNTEIFTYALQGIESGGTAEDTVIRDKGIQWIYAGGTSRNTKIQNGGIVYLQAGGNLSGQTEFSGGTLNILGSNAIFDLSLDNSTVNFVRGSSFSSLNIKNLNGRGRFYLNSNLSQNQSDHINIENGDGSFGLVIHDYSMESSLPSEFKIIDEAAGAHDSFYLVGNAVDIGAFHYNLREENGNWVLVRTEQLTDTSLIAKNTFASLSSLFYTHLSPVYNHLRTAPGSSSPKNGLWVKSLGRRIKFKFKDDTGSRINVFGLETGYDRDVWSNGGNILSLGFYGGYTDSRQKYDRSGKGNGNTYSLGLYSAFNTADRYFINIVGSYFWHDQKITSHMPDGTGVISKYDTNSWQASVFAGRRFDFAEGWFIEPSVGADYMMINGLRYRTSFNTLINASDADYLSTEAGVAAGRGFKLDNDALIEAYGRFNLVYDWDGKIAVKVADYKITEKLSSVHYEFGLGLNAALKDDWSAYVEAAAQVGGKVTLPWEINIGLQFDF